MAHGGDNGIFSGRSSLPRGTRGRLTRRDALKLAGLSGLGMALLTACGQQAPAAKPAEPAKPAESKPAEAAKPAAPAAQQAPAQKPADSTAAKPAEAAKPAATPKDGGTFRAHIYTEDPPTLDPYLNVSFRVQEFASFYYSRLLYSKKGPGIPAQAYIMEGDLAETWKPSADGKTWTFNLRPDAKWHNLAPMNGRPVTAADVAWSFERFMKVSPQKSTFDIVDSVSAPSEKTVEFKLKDAYAPFEAAIGSPIFWILPKEVIEADGDASKRVVGSGGFVFDKHDKGISFTGKKNKDYYHKGQPHIDEVVALIIPDTATQMAGLRGKELDFVQVAQQDLESLKKTNPEIQIVEWEYLYIPFIYWHLDQPPYNDPRVRQAFSMAVDRDEMINVVYNGRGNWNSAVPWALSEWWLDPRGAEMGPNAKFFKHDPAEAKKLLAAAGYPDGLKVDLISTPGYSQTFNQQVELIAAQLKKSGIDATIKMQEYAAYIGTTFRGQFPSENNTMVFGLETPFTEPHDFLFNMYHPKGTRNHGGVNDPKLTEMIEQQAKTLDKAERKKQIFEIQRYLGEMMYYPPNAASYRSAGLAPHVRDFYPRSDYGLGSEIVPKLWLDR
jgi:peptide/nickel transport system substrate-binding protein